MTESPYERKPRKMKKSNIELMLKLIDEGFNQKEIGDKLGVSNVAICYHMKKNLTKEERKVINSRNCAKGRIKAHETKILSPQQKIENIKEVKL